MKNFAKNSLQQFADLQLSKQQQLNLKGGNGDGDSDDDIVITDLIMG